MKKKILMTAAGLITGIAVFTTTAFVALANNSNYETYKNGFFKLLKSNNFTADLKLGIDVDGEYILDFQNKIYQNPNKFYTVTKSSFNGYSIDAYANYSGEDGYASYRDGKLTYESSGGYYSYDPPVLTNAQEKLINVIADMSLGDLKNNIVSEDNKIYIDVKEYQIPALSHAVFDVIKEQMILEQERIDFGDDQEDKALEKVYNMMLDSDVGIKSANFEGEYNEDGYLTLAKGSAIIASKNTSLKFYFDFNFSDFGITDVVKPDTTEKADDYYELPSAIAEDAI